MDVKFEIAKDGIDPVVHIGEYFTHLREKEISVLVGSIALLQKVDLGLLQDVLELEQIEVEEKIGRLMQTDLLDGHFTQDHFILEKFNYKIKMQHPNLTLDDRSLLAYLKARFEVTFRELQDAFNISYASSIFILSRFIARGLLTPQKLDNHRYRFIVHFGYEKRDVDQISEFEKELVGYFQLAGKSTIEDVAKELEEPEHKILSTMTSLILSDMIIAKFEVVSKLFGGVQLFIELNKFQVYFPQKSIQVLSNDERNFIGYLSLRNSASVDELSDFLSKTNTETIKLASSLYATNQLDIKFDENKFQIVNYRPLSVNRSIEILSKIHSFNYRIMIGLIQTQNQLSIKEIASKMEISEDEVLDGLISLYLEGLIDGKLDERFIFTLQALKTEEQTKEITLERWESIILGALISEQVISWPKITALLNVDRTTARNRGFEFISRGISRTVAKDTVLVLKEVPSLPPMVQISSLDTIERQILGYLKSTSRPRVDKIASIFSLSKIETFRIIYYLTGVGLFRLKRNKNVLNLENIVKIEPEISSGELPLIDQQVIRSIELQVDTRVDLREIAKETELSMKEMKLVLYEIIAYGFYSGLIEGDIFIKKSNLYESMDSGVCLYCAEELSPRNEKCENCGRALPQCGVCKGNLNSNQKLLACPNCKNLSHAGHIKQWLQIKGQCPFCRKRIGIKDLLVQQPLL